MHLYDGFMVFYSFKIPRLSSSGKKWGILVTSGDSRSVKTAGNIVQDRKTTMKIHICILIHTKEFPTQFHVGNMFSAVSRE